MNLHYKINGKGPPVIILHGLFGMLDNWRTIAKMLGEKYQCILVDLRNHGKSPHVDDMNYKAMSEDILDLMSILQIEKAIILGHSMGGKVAMQFAFEHEERVSKLVVVDISPGKYPPHHAAEIEAIQSLNPSELKDRGEAESALRKYLGQDEATIQFLLKNLSRLPAGGFSWKANMPAILAHYGDLMAGIDSNKPFHKPTLFVKGASSDSMKEEDWNEIQQLFPQAQLVTIANAGHWVHVDQPRALIDALFAFMES